MKLLGTTAGLALFFGGLYVGGALGLAGVFGGPLLIVLVAPRAHAAGNAPYRAAMEDFLRKNANPGIGYGHHD